jgi:opine dehydrogenase
MADPRAGVVGSGPGGLAVAADLAGHYAVTITDLPPFMGQLDAVSTAGGVTVNSSWHGETLVRVAVAGLENAVGAAELVVVAVPAPHHLALAQAVVPALASGATLLFVGDGGGGLVAAAVLARAGREDVLAAETNCLPHISRSLGPGRIAADRKTGGVMLAALPADRTEDLRARLEPVWPQLCAALSAWDTLLLNYDAIDTAPVALLNAAAIERRPGGFLLWGEGASPAVVRVIVAVDAELLAVRRALGGGGPGFHEMFVAQGLAPAAETFAESLARSKVLGSVRPAGSPEALERLTASSLAWTLAVGARLGRGAGVPTPTLDAVVALGSAMLGRELGGEASTLVTLGIEGADAETLVRVGRGTRVLPRRGDFGRLDIDRPSGVEQNARR